MRLIWIALGFLSLGLGTAGAFLPLLPTVPLYLLAGFFFARSSDRLHDWLVNHRTFGPPIRDWYERRAISRRAKWLASLSILAAFLMSVWLGVPGWVLLLQAVVLSAVAIFIWTRNDD